MNTIFRKRDNKDFKVHVFAIVNVADRLAPFFVITKEASPAYQALNDLVDKGLADHIDIHEAQKQYRHNDYGCGLCPIGGHTDMRPWMPDCPTWLYRVRVDKDWLDEASGILYWTLHKGESVLKDNEAEVYRLEENLNG